MDSFDSSVQFHDQFPTNATQPLKKPQQPRQVLQCPFKKEIALSSGIDAFHGHLKIVDSFQISYNKDIFKK